MNEVQKNQEPELDAESDEDSMIDRYLAFRIGDEDYGIAIQFITEIVGIQKIAAIPDMPDFIRGVINLRGQVIPVMDVRTRFRLPMRNYDERTCVIVVQIDQQSIGLVVDAVNEVTHIPQDAISPPPLAARNERSHYIQGIGKVADDVKILLD